MTLTEYRIVKVTMESGRVEYMIESRANPKLAWEYLVNVYGAPMRYRFAWIARRYARRVERMRADSIPVRREVIS